MKKNKVFQNKLDKDIGNNQKSFSISDDKKNNIKDDVTLNDDLTAKEKIEKLFNRNGYVFNVLVEIVTSKKTYHTKIAGKVNNHLITLDNDIICINDIQDIIVKE